MLIGDLEQKTKLERATIRFYEKEGLIQPERRENGYRTYSEADAETLLKIKLLRQLGMSLDKIKGLQQGSEDFSCVLNDQIQSLEKQIMTAHRARDVCKEMLGDGVCYQNLNAGYYLELLSRPAPNTPAWAPKIRTDFKEPVPREYHPVRRLIARFLDYSLLNSILRFFLIVVLRVRPFGDFLSILITYGSYFLLIPVGALLLHRFGTTPGKWLMGLRVESCNGGLLSFSDAKEREWQVLRSGLGWGIPFWELWRLYRSYKDYSMLPDMDWDRECEYIYRKWNWHRKAAFAGMLCVLLTVSIITAADSIKPKYRGEELTVSQFAENYNFYLSVFTDDVQDTDRLKSDGTRYPEERGVVTVYLGGEPSNKNASFEYETEDGHIQKISYSNRWTDVGYLNPITVQCQIAAITVLLSQTGTQLDDVQAFEELWAEMLASPEGSRTYQNMELRWNVEAENCEMVSNGSYMAIDEDAPSSLQVSFEIIISQTNSR